MLQMLARADGRPYTHATVRRFGVYLDTHTIINLAKSAVSRRQRFAAASAAGVDLMFSVSNAMELAGLQGASVTQVRTFLDSVGPHWFPLELDPFEITRREQQGRFGAEACSSAKFMEDFRKTRMLGAGSALLDLSEHFFRLGAVLDWTQPQRDSIQNGLRDMDATLVARIEEHRNKFESDSAWLDRKFPALPFNPAMPGTFTYVNMVRQLILDARGFSLKKGDGLDFCHAIVGISFAKFATLDKHWKRRVGCLPRPNGLAQVYYAPELDMFLDHIEQALAG